MSFYEVLSLAISDLLENGYDSQERLEAWLVRLNDAARRSLVPPSVLQRDLESALNRIFKRATSGNKLEMAHQGVSKFTLQNVKPKLRAELDRRILASASLIKLNREATIAKTLQRFAGWASSVPKGGSDIESRAKIKKDVKRGMSGLSFEERRVLTDQGHKLIAAINDIVATDGGAIAATWRHVKEGYGYQARPEHEARDGKVYVVRDSWAKKDGLIKPIHGYTDDIEQPAELPYCRCRWVFLYSLGRMPPDMLTSKGKQALEDARNALKSA